MSQREEGKVMNLDFKHNLNEFAKEVLGDLLNTISRSKKQLHQQAADIIKEDIKENVYDEEFQKVVNPLSTWQELKKSLGFPSRPGHFTRSTLNALVAKATEDIGEVMLKGEWPSLRDGLIGDKFDVTSLGVMINSFRDEKRGIRIRNLFIPAEAFSTKRYGSWIDEDITFMKLRPNAEKKVLDDMSTTLEREMQKILSNFQKRVK